MKQKYYQVCYFSFLALFLIGIWIINIFSLIICPFLVEKKKKKITSFLIIKSTRIYLHLLRSSGALICNVEVLDEIDSKQGKLVIANHPSLLDAILFLSRLPGLKCIYKAKLNGLIIHPQTAQSAGYLANDGGLDLIKELVRILKRGETALIFPEGTRTEKNVLTPFNSGYAVAARQAQAPIQLVRISSNSDLMGKGQSLLKTTQFPAVYDLTLGPVVDPKGFVTAKKLNSHIENYFRNSLSNEICSESYLPSDHSKKTVKGVFQSDFTVPENPFYCRGHMPGKPIVPAYVQLIWARLCHESHMGKLHHQFAFTNWKFISPILPQDSIQLILVQTKESWKVTLRNGTEIVSKGKIGIQQ